MSDDGYDSISAEEERAWRYREATPHGIPMMPEEPPCSSLFDPEEEPEASDDVEVLMSAEDGPVALIYNGKRYRVVPDEG